MREGNATLRHTDESEDLLEAFDRWGYDERGWADTTRELYGQCVRRAERWLWDTCCSSLQTATSEQLRTWLSTLPRTAASRNLARKAITGYCAFLVDRGIRVDDPTAPLRPLRPKRGVPRARDAATASAIWRAAWDEGPRSAALVGLMLWAGLRQTEARSMRWPSIEAGWVQVLGKGAKTRRVPLHHELARAIADWRAASRSPDWLFPSNRREGEPIAGATVLQRVRRIGAAAGVPNLAPHQLRHTYATRLLDLGANLRVIQELLGHASLDTTQVYTRVHPAGMECAVELLDFGELAEERPRLYVVGS